MDFYTNVVEHRSKILLTGYKDGKRYSQRTNYSPTLFNAAPPGTETRWRTAIEGTPVRPKQYASIWEAKEYLRSTERAENLRVHGLDRFAYAYINEHFENMQYDTRLIKRLIMDIEVYSPEGFPHVERAEWPVVSITMMYKDITWVLGLKDYSPPDPKVKYFKCKDEAQLLQRFLKLWGSDNYRPDVVTGWYIQSFDIPYLVRRITKLLGHEEAIKLSPWGILKERTFEVFGKPQTVFMPIGINVLDYIDLYKKFVLTPRENYKLGTIGWEELGEAKLDYSKYGTIHKMYDEDFNLFIDYNIHDCTIIAKLDNKLRLLELVYEFAYDSGTNFEDALRAVITWDITIHNHLWKQKRAIPPFKRDDGPGFKAEGAYVKDVMPGMYDWIVSLDLQSLYPHLMIGYNISPDAHRGRLPEAFTVDQYLDAVHVEKWLPWLQERDLCLAANGVLFDRKEQGFMGELMQVLFDKRKLYKDLMKDAKKAYLETKDQEQEFLISKYDNLQKNAKIKLNSCYGAMLNDGFRYKSRDTGEAITFSGQLVIRTAERVLNQKINELLGTTGKDYVVAADTDSAYLHLDGLVKKSGLTDIEEIVNFLDQFCETQLQPLLEDAFQTLAKNMNCYKQAMYMKRESIAERGIFIIKKRNIIKVWDIEGVRFSEPEIKMTGIEAVRSSTPTACREAIKDCLKIIMNGTEDEAREFIQAFKAKFETLPFEQIAFPRGVKDLEKYTDSTNIYKPGCPIAVRASLVYNYHLKRLGLVGQYDLITSDSKIKFAYLWTPNKFQENVIAVPGDALPKEFDLDRYIDFDMQFDKAFNNPIQNILDVLGWKAKKPDTLDAIWL